MSFYTYDLQKLHIRFHYTCPLPPSSNPDSDGRRRKSRPKNDYIKSRGQRIENSYARREVASWGFHVSLPSIFDMIT